MRRFESCPASQDCLPLCSLVGKQTAHIRPTDVRFIPEGPDLNICGGPPGGAVGVPTTRRCCALWGRVSYKHFGARLAGSPARAVFACWGASARLGRFDSCTLYQDEPGFASVVQRIRTVGLHLTDTSPNRAPSLAGLARRSSSRSIIARCWFDSNILHQIFRVTGRDG